MLRGTASRQRCWTSSRTSPCSRSPRRADQADRQEPPVPGSQQCRRSRPGDPQRPEGQAGRLLAYPGQRQERFDDVLRPEGAAQDARQLDFRGGHRPRGTGRPDLQELRQRRRGHRSRRAQCAPTAASTWKQLLQEDHRYVFTLIQKFHTETARSTRCSRSGTTSSSSPTKPTAASTTCWR